MQMQNLETVEMVINSIVGYPISGAAPFDFKVGVQNVKAIYVSEHVFENGIDRMFNVHLADGTVVVVHGRDVKFTILKPKPSDEPTLPGIQ